MTEEEYILTSDKRVIELAQNMLADLIPSNNKYISPVEHRNVLKILAKWRRNLYSALLVK